MQLKEMENNILIKLVFDTENEENLSFEKVFENIEIVEYLKFDDSTEPEEITTKENVKILRILLKLIMLVYDCHEAQSDFIISNEKLTLQSIFSESKRAFNPEKFRF